MFTRDLEVDVRSTLGHFSKNVTYVACTKEKRSEFKE